jgi:hypothetical protein
MSVCDKCIRPGECCRRFPLPGLPTFYTKLEVLVFLASYCPTANTVVGLPFYDPVFSADDQMWTVACHWVTPEGRCGNYDIRPHYPCGDYQPGTDPLCAHHVPRIGLCPELTRPTEEFRKHLNLGRS